MPEIGERSTDGTGVWTLEWTGGAWTQVCGACDVPMTARDDHGYLCCDTCKQRAVDQKPKEAAR